MHKALFHTAKLKTSIADGTAIVKYYSQAGDKNVVRFEVGMNDVTAMHLVHNVNQMNRENANKPVFKLPAVTLARVHQILAHIRHGRSVEHGSFQSPLVSTSYNSHQYK